MKITALIIFLNCFGSVFAQLNGYYVLGNNYSSEVSTRDQPYLTEFGNVSYGFASNRMNRFLTEQFNFERIQQSQKKVSDSITQYYERWKSKDNPEINPETKFIELRYTVQHVTLDSIITNLECYGYEEYIGNLYRDFWNASLNLHANDTDVLSSWTFRDDLIQLHHSSKNKLGKTVYWITVVPKLMDQNKFVAELNETLIARKKEADDFKALRSSKVYHFAELDTAYYQQKRNEMITALRAVLETENNINGDVKVTVKADTLGQNWIEVAGKNARVNQALREELLDFYYKNHVYNNSKMTTVDEFMISYESLTQRVELVKHNQRVSILTDNHEKVESVARKAAQMNPTDHADLVYDVNVSNVDGKNHENVKVTSLVERRSFGQAVATFFIGLIVVVAALFSETE